MNQTSRARWLIHRLAAMSPAEIAGRAAAKLKEKLEPAALRRLSGMIPAALDSRETPLLPPAADAPEALRRQLAAEVPEIRAGRRVLFNHLPVEVGLPVRWQTDPLAGVDLFTTASAHGLNHRILPKGADIRVVWEVNRWSSLVRMAMAQRLGLITDGAEFCFPQLTAWREANPLGCGWNWTSPMEPAIRLIHLVWIDALLDAPPDGRSIVAKLAFEHAFWIWRYRSFGSSANNHLLGELAALVCATARWPELQNICALPLVTDALEREILLQFAPDGGNREQALHYHLFALEYGVLAAHSLHALGQPLRSEVRDRLGAAADFFATVAAPAEGWDYGDSDDAHVVPLFTRDISHAGEWRGWCRRERSATALSYWLPLRDQVIGAPRSGDLSENWTCLPDSGFAVWQKGEWFLRFDASPLGYLATRAHGHLDALHLSAWLGEDAFLIDSGTGSYFVDPTLRTTLAGADRHNGPFLRNGGYPQRQGTFLWSQPHSDPFLETAAQGVRGEIQLKPGKISRVIRETSGGFTVEDRASGDAQVRWTLAPDWKIEATGRDHFTAKLGERQVSLTFTGAARPPVLEKVTVSPSFRRTEKTLSIVLPMNASGVLMSAFTVLSRP